MARVRLQDKYEFELVSAFDFTIAQVVDLEKLLGIAMERWSSTAETQAVLFASAQAADVDLTWEDIGALKPSEIVRVKEPEGVTDADPPATAGDEPASDDSADTSPRRSRSTSSGGTE